MNRKVTFSDFPLDGRHKTVHFNSPAERFCVFQYIFFVSYKKKIRYLIPKCHLAILPNKVLLVLKVNKLPK